MVKTVPGVFLCSLVLMLGFGCREAPATQDNKDSALTAVAMEHVSFMLDSGYYNQIPPYLDSFYRVHALTSDRALVIKYERLAELYYYQKIDNAISARYLDSLSAIVQKGNGGEYDQDKLLSYYFLSGHLALSNKKYDDAFKFYYKGRLLIDSAVNGCGNQRYYNTLAFILYRQEKYLESVEYFRKCYENASFCNPEDLQRVINTKGEALSNMGICYENAGLYDSAIYYYDKALDHVDKHAAIYNERALSALKFKGIILGNKGGALLKFKKYKEAEMFLKQSIANNDRPGGEVGDAILTKIKLADLYMITKQYDSCRNLIMQLDTDMVNRPYLISEMRLANLKYRYYTYEKNYELALKNLNHYHIIKDSVKSSTNYSIESHTDHIREFENLEKRFELELLQKESEIKNWYLYLSALVALMAVIIISLLLRRRNVNKKHIAELTMLNEQVRDSNDKLSNSLKLLQKSEEENSRIIKIVAHDLRSPIAGIMTLVRMIRQDGHELTKDEFSEYIELVEKAGGNALNFIEDMLNQNRSNQHLVRNETDLLQLLESCARIMQPQAAKKDQHITLSATSTIIRVNEEKVWRLINNIISNSIKFSPPSTEISIRAVSEKGFVIISIRDEGMGIPDSIKDKMFTMFASPGRVGTNGEPSFGLGMAISKQIVDVHNGKIWFESGMGKGTTFFVKLPVE